MVDSAALVSGVKADFTLGFPSGITGDPRGYYLICQLNVIATTPSEARNMADPLDLPCCIMLIVNPWAYNGVGVNYR